MRFFDHYTDEELVLMLEDENISAFEEIYNRYWAKLYSSAYKRTSSKEASEEIVQDLFTSLWVNKNKIESTLTAYLYTAVRYRVFNYYSKEYVRRNYHESVQDIDRGIDNSTEETILLNDLTKHIEKEVSLLPIKCRSVYSLSRNENKSNKEIAAVLGISEKTVENHMTKALKRLKVKLYMWGLF